MHSTPDPTHVDTVEQHSQLRGVHLYRATVVGDPRGQKSASLEPFVIENEPTPIPKQDLAAIASAPQKHEQMPCEQVHSPLPAHDATQAIVTTAQIDWLDGEVDPNARWQREHGLPQPGDDSSNVRRIAALFETKPQTSTELELDLLGSSATQPNGQQCQCLGFRVLHRRCLVEVVLQGRVRNAMFRSHVSPRQIAFFGLRYEARPKLQSAF